MGQFYNFNSYILEIKLFSTRYFRLNSSKFFLFSYIFFIRILSIYMRICLKFEKIYIWRAIFRGKPVGMYFFCFSIGFFNVLRFPFSILKNFLILLNKAMKFFYNNFIYSYLFNSSLSAEQLLLLLISLSSWQETKINAPKSI